MDLASGIAFLQLFLGIVAIGAGATVASFSRVARKRAIAKVVESELDDSSKIRALHRILNWPMVFGVLEVAAWTLAFFGVTVVIATFTN